MTFHLFNTKCSLLQSTQYSVCFYHRSLSIANDKNVSKIRWNQNAEIFFFLNNLNVAQLFKDKNDKNVSKIGIAEIFFFFNNLNLNVIQLFKEIRNKKPVHTHMF